MDMRIFGMSRMQLHNFSTVSLLNHELANQIHALLLDAVQHRGHAFLVVSGGRTPVELFKLLARADLPWNRVTISLADERCVTVDNVDRNEHTVRTFLLQHEALSAQFISLYDETINPVDSLMAVERTLSSLPTFDVLILGMGEDGHTASLFPCSEELAEGLDDQARDVLVIKPKSAPYQRVSMSKKRLMDSRTIFIPLIGQKKREVLSQALSISDPLLMPVCAFLNHQSANVQVMYAP